MIVHCYEHIRGYFDFMSSTIRLSELYPDHKVTYAIPQNKWISQILLNPNTMLCGKPDCVFHALSAKGATRNRLDYDKFCTTLTPLISTKDVVRVDFRYGRNAGIRDDLRGMLEFKPELISSAIKVISESIDGNYCVIHARTGDNEMVYDKEINLDKWKKAIEVTLSKCTLPTIFVSDSEKLKDAMSGHTVILKGSPTHTGFKSDVTGINSFLVDVITIQRASKVTAIVDNKWCNTAFSRIPAMYAGVPFNVKHIDEAIDD